MVARSALNTRSASRQVEGFLIRAHGGYGCVQPWPMFGHADLPDHWAALAQGKSLPLLDQALACAQQDGVARSAGKSWWTECPVPSSHATVTDLETQEDAAIAAGFAIWKLKVSMDDARTVAELLESKCNTGPGSGRRNTGGASIFWRIRFLMKQRRGGGFLCKGRSHLPLTGPCPIQRYPPGSLLFGSRRGYLCLGGFPQRLLS